MEARTASASARNRIGQPSDIADIVAFLASTAPAGLPATSSTPPAARSSGRVLMAIAKQQAGVVSVLGGRIGGGGGGVTAADQLPVQEYGRGSGGQGGADRDQGDLPACHATRADHDRRHGGGPVVFVWVSAARRRQLQRRLMPADRRWRRSGGRRVGQGVRQRGGSPSRAGPPVRKLREHGLVLSARSGRLPGPLHKARPRVRRAGPAYPLRHGGGRVRIPTGAAT